MEYKLGDTIYYNSGNVGIDTIIPNAPLEILHNTDLGTKPHIILNSTTGSQDAIEFQFSGTPKARIRMDDGGGLMIGTMSNTAVNIKTNDQVRMKILNNGNVGIGTLSPGSKISVSGGGTFGSNYADSVMTDGYVAISGNFGIGTTGPLYPLHVKRSVANIYEAVIDNEDANGWSLNLTS